MSTLDLTIFQDYVNEKVNSIIQSKGDNSNVVILVGYLSGYYSFQAMNRIDKLDALPSSNDITTSIIEAG